MGDARLTLGADGSIDIAAGPDEWEDPRPPTSWNFDASSPAGTVLRRLTRVTAQIAGLMLLTLIKLDVPLAARNWARTARVAADEAGDPAIRRSFVHRREGHTAKRSPRPPTAVTVTTVLPI
jgi:hypothetical protein